MDRRSALRELASATAALALSGCGGGAGNTSPVDQAPEPVSPTAPPPEPGESLPAWVRNLPLWHWYSIPNTALSSVEPTPRPVGGDGPRAKIVDWCGAGLKRQGSVYLIGAAGGHTGYAGNEVDALKLNDEHPRWVQLRAPSDASAVVDTAQFYLDRRPSATHTYYATQFVNARNRLMVMPSPGLGFGPEYRALVAAPPADWPYRDEPPGTDKGLSFSFDMAAGDWDPPEYVARYTGGGGFIACVVAKHPVTEDIYYNRAGADWWRWTQSTNTWVKLSSHTDPGYGGAAIDPTRNRILVVGSYGAIAPRVYDLNANPVSVSFGGLGVSALTFGWLTGHNYPGLVYDEANDTFLSVSNDGTSPTDLGTAIKVMRVHAGTWFVDEPAITGTPPATRVNGIQNAVQYVPELKGIVIANDYAGNVQFMRTAL